MLNQTPDLMRTSQHAPIVGHGGNDCILNHRIGFVEWANSNDVEAVFCGHTHEDNKFGEPYPGKIESDEIADPDDFTQNTIPFDWYTVYIETWKST